MSEKGKNIEMEEETIDHWSHEHPLTLVEARGKDYCYGCERRFGNGEHAYGCSINGCKYSNLLHEECAVVATEIRYPLHHPQHILNQRLARNSIRSSCGICGRMVSSIGYRCTSSGCWFLMHQRCAQGEGVIDATTTHNDEQRRGIIHHPSHPNHELKPLRRRFSIKCDACGTTHRDSSYICTKDDCQYLIHQKCASLPQDLKREDHHHSLSLSFHVPLEYIRYDYKCDVCSLSFLPNYWIYHCPLCRYIVHVKCAFNKPLRITENDANTYNRKHHIHLPTDEVVGNIITPFVMRQRRGRRRGRRSRGREFLPPITPDDDKLVNVKYKFHRHQHRLT
ncbi:uncharacterized protein LOC125202264 isoform X1 [Salvia hispanica]|uniref:uncharacterized protein LOC125202264 isoform X1 n=1 Tax=Salvia hispanica TaxID=49212 RepID=UPI0020093E3F|nr:uncharacterized protein LOC125202264 isoform X1 [Salvia hispanica]